MPKKMDTKTFISKSKLVHANKYDYSKSEVINNTTKTTIICDRHGDFLQSPADHTSGRGCKKCGYEKSADLKRLTIIDFVTKSNMIHNDKYNYEYAVYVNNTTPIIVTCKKHGNWECLPQNHMSGSGCPICYGTPNKGIDQFIKEANEIHNHKYDYSKSVYKTALSKITITCPLHGDFEQRPNDHLVQKSGCLSCSHVYKPSLKEFIDKSNIIHNNRYNYSKSEYINNKTKLTIICPDHGEFRMSPSSHTNQKYGCPTCNMSKGEKLILKYLIDNDIKFETQKTFDDCSTDKIKSRLRFDFYIPDYNTLIEYDGIQHFKPITFFGGDEALDSLIVRDKIKTEYCINNNIQLIRFNYKQSDKSIIKVLDGRV